jgi:hypothetical protein
MYFLCEVWTLPLGRGTGVRHTAQDAQVAGGAAAPMRHSISLGCAGTTCTAVPLRWGGTEGRRRFACSSLCRWNACYCARCTGGRWCGCSDAAQHLIGLHGHDMHRGAAAVGRHRGPSSVRMQFALSVERLLPCTLRAVRRVQVVRFTDHLLARWVSVLSPTPRSYMPHRPVLSPSAVLFISPYRSAAAAAAAAAVAATTGDGIAPCLLPPLCHHHCRRRCQCPYPRHWALSAVARAHAPALIDLDALCPKDERQQSARIADCLTRCARGSMRVAHSVDRICRFTRV